MAELTASYLEELISDATVGRQKLVEALGKPLIRPKNSSFFTDSYLKYDLADTINQALGNASFGVQDVYGSLNKEPMKRVGYGLLNSKGIPKELFWQMGYLGAKGQWLMVYYVTGVFNKKVHEDDQKETLQKEPLHLHVLDTAIAGINLLKIVHNEMRMPPELRRNPGLRKIDKMYTTDIRIPYENEIRQAYSEARASWKEQKRVMDDCEIGE